MEDNLLTKTEAESRSLMISDVEYELFLLLTHSESYNARIIISFHLSDLISPIWLDYKGQLIESLQINSNPEAIVYQNNRIILNNVSSGINKVEIKFTNLFSTEVLGLISVKDPEDNELYIHSQFEPFAANRMIPCFDQPDLKSTISLKVLTPGYWKAISNTIKLSETPLTDNCSDFFNPSNLNCEGFVLHEFKKSLKISTYLFAVCAGPYVQFINTEFESKIPISLYCRKTLSSTMSPSMFFNWITKGLDYYNDFFSFDYPFEKYDQVFIPDHFMYAMENVGCVIMDEKLIAPNNDSRLLFTCMIVLHEMSHMWFGDIVTMKWWDDVWLNESFATFISCLCLDETGLFKDIWLLFYDLQQRGRTEDELSTTHPISTSINNTNEMMAGFDGICYFKGSSVLKQLFFLLGKDNFQQALRKYISQYKYKNAEFQDLVNIMAEFSNDINLIEWAQMWIKTAGINELCPCIERNEENAITSFKILQKATSVDHQTLRNHKIKVQLYDTELKQINKIIVHLNSLQETSVDITGNYYVMLNADNEDYCKITLDQLSYGAFSKELWKIEDNLARIQIISAIWGMVLDLKVSVKEFIETALRVLPYEMHPYNVEYIVKLTKRALLTCFKDETYINSAFHQLFSIILNKLSSGIHTNAYKKLIISILYCENDIIQAISWLSLDSSITLSQFERWKVLM